MATKPDTVLGFATEAKERTYWDTHDSAGHVDWSKGRRVHFPNLKLSTASISLRLPLGLLQRIKIWLAEMVR